MACDLERLDRLVDGLELLQGPTDARPLQDFAEKGWGDPP